jgi:hypothetical protein
MNNLYERNTIDNYEADELYIERLIDNGDYRCQPPLICGLHIKTCILFLSLFIYCFLPLLFIILIFLNKK